MRRRLQFDQGQVTLSAWMCPHSKVTVGSSKKVRYLLNSDIQQMSLEGQLTAGSTCKVWQCQKLSHQILPTQLPTMEHQSHWNDLYCTVRVYRLHQLQFLTFMYFVIRSYVQFIRCILDFASLLDLLQHEMSCLLLSFTAYHTLSTRQSVSSLTCSTFLWSMVGLSTQTWSLPPKP